jgi:hypothetical protein
MKVSKTVGKAVVSCPSTPRACLHPRAFNVELEQHIPSSGRRDPCGAKQCEYLKKVWEKQKGRKWNNHVAIRKVFGSRMVLLVFRLLG